MGAGVVGNVGTGGGNATHRNGPPPVNNSSSQNGHHGSFNGGHRQQQQQPYYRQYNQQQRGSHDQYQRSQNSYHNHHPHNRESSNNHRDSHHYNSHRGHYGGQQHNGNNSAADRGAGPERRGLAGGKQSFASQSSSISSNNTTNNNVSNNQHHQTPLPAASAQKWVPPSRRGHVVGGQQQPHSAQQQQAPVVASPAAPAENCSVNSNNSLGGQQAATSSPVYTPPQQQQQKYVPPQANQVIERQRLEEEKNIAFKKIRGVLNKLTPEKFDKLINEILSVDLSSTDILKGVIILIFDKALVEPKYSSMYAQLCKRLDEKSPVDPNRNITIFKFHLLNQCKEEFENRSKANTSFDNGYEASEDELEARFMAKRKMLGNIKFIGELGKLQIVHDRVLHMCCEALVLGWKNKPLSEQTEDLECLCHLMRTCGRILDSSNGKFRMDQYFERMDQVIESEKMPVRIRFMVQDIVDLRRNKWATRRAGKDMERGPRTIQQVREDAARDGFIYMPQEDTPPAQGMSPMAKAAASGGPLADIFSPFGFAKSGEDDFFGGAPRGGPVGGGSGSAATSGGGGVGGPNPASMNYMSGVGYLGTGPGAISGGYDDDHNPGYGYKAPLGGGGGRGRSPSPTPLRTNTPPGHQQQQPMQQRDLNPSKAQHQLRDMSLRDREPPKAASPTQASQTSSTSHTPSGEGESRPFWNNRDGAGDNGYISSERDNYSYRGGRGGGSYRGGGRGGFSNSDDKHSSVPDFGDRYSANRTRDQQRREANGWEGGERGGGGGFNGTERGGFRGGGRGGFANNRGRGDFRNNQAGPPNGANAPRFSRGGPGGNGDFGDGPNNGTAQQQNNRFDNGSSGDSMNLPPRFNKGRFGNGGTPPPGGSSSPGATQTQQPHQGGFNRDRDSPGHSFQHQPYQGRNSMPFQNPSAKDIELSLRPASMVFKPKTPSLLPKSAMAKPGSADMDGRPGGPVMMQQKEANILIKQAPADTGKAAKKKAAAAAAQANKGPTREEVFAKVNSILDILFRSEAPTDEIEDKKVEEEEETPKAEKEDVSAGSARLTESVSAWTEEGWLPAKMTQTAVTQVYTAVMTRPDRSDRQLIRDFLLKVMSEGKIDSTHCKEAFLKAVNTADKELSKDSTSSASSSPLYLAEMAAWKISQNLANLEEIADCLNGIILSSSALRKLLFVTLSVLAESLGPAAVLQMYNESKGLKLKDHLDEDERKMGDEKMAEILSAHKLSFLMPMLAIRQDMTTHLSAEGATSDSLLKWIQSNVGAEFLKQPDFIVTLLSVVLNHVATGGDASKEKERLANFRSLLRSFVTPDDKRMQLTAVYALQVWAHSQGFPNGVLLRAFVNCYELDIIDEHAFLLWKEDVNDFYPGKGQALFQVNKWLNWLEEAESDSEEEDE